MKRTIIALAAAAALFASPALSAEWGFGAGGFVGGLAGAGQSSSGAGNLSGSFKMGNSTANAGSQSYGRAESAFGVGIGTMPDTIDDDGNVIPGGPASGVYGNFVGANVGSGSMSNASTSATGNGFSGAGSIGGGFGQTTLGGVGGAIGGFVTAP